MRQISFLFFAILFVLSMYSYVFAQNLQQPASVFEDADSVKSAANKQNGLLTKNPIKFSTSLKQFSNDTLKSKDSAKVDQYKEALKNKLKLPSDSIVKNKASSYAKAKLKAISPLGKSNQPEKKEDSFNFSAENSVLYLTDSPLKNGSAFLNNFSVAGKFSIAKIPINLDLSNNYNSDGGFEPFQSNLFKFNFDKEGLLNSLKSDVERVADFKKSFLQGMELPDFAGKAVIGKIRSMPEAKFLNSNPAFLSYMRNPEKVNELLSLNDKQLKEKISEFVAMHKQELNAAANKQIANTNASKLTDNVNELKEKAENKEDLLKAASGKSGQQQLKANITDSITTVISSIRNKLAENGLDAQKVNLVQKIVSGKGDLSDFETELFNELSKNPKTTGLQSAFSRVRQFETGAFADKLPGSFLNRDVFVKGINLSLKTQKGPVSLGFGKQNDLGTAKDGEFQNSVYSTPKIFSYLSVPTNQSAFGSGKLSWVGVFSKQESMPGFQSSSLGRNSMTFTVSQTLATKKMGKFTVDVSKSANQYKNTLTPGSDHIMLDKSVLSNYFSDDLFETMSMGLNHDFEDERLDLNSNLYFNYAGVGYQNPGSAGGTNMKMRLGGSLKKKFYNNRLALNLRSDLKNTPVSFSSNAHWQNFQVQFDSRYRLSKKVNINVKYIENGMNKNNPVNNVEVYSSRKFQLGGNASYKILGKYSFSNLSISQQDVLNHQLSASNSNFITFNYLQSIVLRNATVSATLFYNKETSDIKLIGDMLNADFSCQYSLLNLNITSGITYLDNQDIARQIGIKQNLQIFAGKHFDINAYADIRKNLIEPLYPDLYTASRGELSIKYYLKNKF